MKLKDITDQTNYVTMAIQLLIMVTFGLAALAKWMEGGIPASFSGQFGETWMGSLPGGLFVPFYTIVVTETLAFLLASISFFRGEWMRERETRYLRYSLVLSLFIFVILTYGLRLTGQFGGAGNAYFYFGTTLVALWYTEKQTQSN